MDHWGTTFFCEEKDGIEINIREIVGNRSYKFQLVIAGWSGEGKTQVDFHFREESQVINFKNQLINSFNNLRRRDVT